MALIFKTDGAWGTGKGSPLTAAEVDLNFYQLLQMAQDLVDNPLQPVNIQTIEVIGNLMYIQMDDYSVFGPFVLPVATLLFTGPFQPNHNYLAGDLFTTADSLYYVTTAYTSGATFVVNGNIQLVMPFPTVFSVGLSFPGKPGFGIEIDEYEASAMWSYRADREWFLLENLPNTVGGLLFECTSAMTLPIMKNLDQIGTIDIAAGQADCTFTFPDNVQFTIGDVLRVLRPVELDDTAKDLTVTFQGRLGLIA